MQRDKNNLKYHRLLKQWHRVVRSGDSDLVMVLLNHYTRFPRSYDVMRYFGFGGNQCFFFDIYTIATNAPDSTHQGLIFFYVVTGCNDKIINLSKLGWLKLWSDFITAINAVEEKRFHQHRNFVSVEYDPTNNL